MQVVYGEGGIVIVDTGLYNDGYVCYLEGYISAWQLDCCGSGLIYVHL